MKRFCQKSPFSSHNILPPYEDLEKFSFSEYDEQPTIMFLASNRESLKSRNSRPFLKYNSPQKTNAKFVTYESNLIESSPQRSQSDGTDGEFVCKYLTPIKKQQFHQLLFKDSVIQNMQTKIKNKAQSQDNKKPLNKIQTNSNIPTKNNLNNQNHSKSCKMVQSFIPFQTNNKNQHQDRQKYAYDIQQKICSCDLTKRINDKNTSIFIDPYSQINFLKLNNKDLFNKLQKQIQKSKALQVKIETLQKQNENLQSLNYQNAEKIKKLQKLLRKNEEERKKYLAKQLQEFNLVKQILIEKNRSKSKNSLQRFQKTNVQSVFFQSLNNALKNTTKQNLFSDSSRSRLKSTKCVNRLQKEYIYGQSLQSSNFTSQNKKQRSKVYTVQSQADRQISVKGQKKYSLEKNIFMTNRIKKSDKQNQKLERFLKGKLDFNKQEESQRRKNKKIVEKQNNPKGQHSLNENRKRSQTGNISKR